MFVSTGGRLDLKDFSPKKRKEKKAGRSVLPLNKAMQRSRFLYIEICFKCVLQALLKAPPCSRCHQAPWNWTDLSITRLDDMGQTISFIRAQRVPLPVLHFCFFGCFLMNFCADSTRGSCGALTRRKEVRSDVSSWCRLAGSWVFEISLCFGESGQRTTRART